VVISPTDPTDARIFIDHHINDSFRGEEIGNPEQVYTGSDVHKDRFELTGEEVEHPDLTNEHIISQGPDPNWILHVHQKTKVRADDPLNPTVTFKAHASCSDLAACKDLPGGCIDRQMEPVP
jgi:hypothetical protein